MPDSGDVPSHQHFLTAGCPALCSEPALSTTASAHVGGSIQAASYRPLVMMGVEGSVMERKGRKCPPICPVTGHPPRMGTRLPTALGGNKLLNSQQR